MAFEVSRPRRCLDIILRVDVLVALTSRPAKFTVWVHSPPAGTDLGLVPCRLTRDPIHIAFSLYLPLVTSLYILAS